MFSKYKNTSYSQSEYEAFKQQCEDNAPIIKSLNISNLNIIDGQTISIRQYVNGGAQEADFHITPDALKDLMKVLGLTYGVYNTFIDTIGSKATVAIIEAIREKIQGEDKKNKISLVISKTTGKVVSVVKYKGNMLATNTYFKLVEVALNGFENNGMIIKNMTVSENFNIAITVVNNNWKFDLEGLQHGLKDEYFTSGMTIIKTPTSIAINPFNERLVCTNGMVDTSKTNAIVLNSSEPKAIEAFFEQAGNFGKGRNSFELDFKRRVIKMLSTNASFAELEKAYNSVNYYLNQAHTRSKMQLNADLHILDINHAFESKYGINLFKESVKVKEKIITDYSMWDLVNKLTYIASNPFKTEYEFSNNDLNSIVFALQKTAGEFTFKPHYDLGISVPQIFEADASTTNAEIINKLKNSMMFIH